MKWYGWVLLIVLGLGIGFTTFVVARGAFFSYPLYSGWGGHGGHGQRDYAAPINDRHHAMGPLTQWLGTSTTQSAALTAKDPTFSEEAALLAQAVRQARQKLLDVLAESSSTDEQINAQVEQVLAAENALQRRVTQYVIKARPILSGAQQRQLLGLYGEHMGGLRAGRGHNVEHAEEPNRYNNARPDRSGGGRGMGGPGGGHHGGH